MTLHTCGKQQVVHRGHGGYARLHDLTPSREVLTAPYVGHDKKDLSTMFVSNSSEWLQVIVFLRNCL